MAARPGRVTAEGAPPPAAPAPPGWPGRGRAAPGVRLFGVVSLAAPGRLGVDGLAASARERLTTPPLGTPVAEVVRAGDLGGVVAGARYAAEPLTAGLVAEYRAVVEAVFAERAVLPAPPGALFRSRAALVAWMELHAASLAEGLRFVEDRAEARVTAAAAPAGPGAPLGAGGGAGGDGGDPVALAADAFAALRREATALLVLRDGGAEAAHAAFLVDRGRWEAFAAAAAREARRRPALRLTCDGPWPPYSFVRLDFDG